MAKDPDLLDFPSELERSIFELAACSRPACIPELMLVAWRVKNWLEPLLYRTLVVSCDDTLDGIPPCTMADFRMIATTKPALLRKSVRNVLFYQMMVPQDVKHLAAFPALENLWVAENSLPPAVEIGALRDLYCSTANFVRMNPLSSSWLDITHLELFRSRDGPGLESVARALTRLTHLTHLALNHTSVIPMSVQLTWMVPLFMQVFGTRSSFTALIILERGSETPPMELDPVEVEPLSAHPHFVMMSVGNYVADWQHGALTGADYWTRADDFIAKRISGEIDRRNFLIEEAAVDA